MFSLSERKKRVMPEPVRIAYGYAGRRKALGRSIRSAGFNLIELMVAVVIVAILSKVALSSYHNSVAKTNRQAAKTALLDLAAREERFYSLNNSYSATPSDLYGTGASATLFPMNVPSTGPALYTIQAPTIVAPATGSPGTFTITAAPAGGQVGDACGSFIINSAGQQTVSGTGSCW